jgi:hypothetical protein
MEEQIQTRTRHILVIGKDPDILKTVLRLLNDFKKADYRAAGTTDVAEGRRLFEQGDIDLVLLTNGLNEVTTGELRSYFLDRKPGIHVLQHYGGGSGLLFNEITYSLQSKTGSHGTDHIA